MINEISTLISKSKNILIIGHYNPDGDVVGASLGLYHFLNNGNRTVNVMLPNDFPGFLKWIPGNEKIIIFSKETETAIQLINKADLVFFVDFNEISRIDKIKPYIENLSVPTILIDHHPTSPRFTDYQIVDPSASSAAELIFILLEQLDMDMSINKTIAECLFTGVMSDTGCFKFNASSPRTFFNISKLLAFGINQEKIHTNLYDYFSADRMKLMGYCLNNKLVYKAEYNTAFISITQKELETFNYNLGDTDGFVNLPLSIKGVLFSALFVENETLVKASFRSKGTFDVNQFARKHFNGGGHINASGGKNLETIKNTLDKFVNLLEEYADLLK